MRSENVFGAFVLAIWMLFAVAGLAYVGAIIWAIIKVTNHFAP